MKYEYKKGDRVRCVSKGSNGGIEVGGIYTVERDVKSDHDEEYVRLAHRNQSYFLNRFEPVWHRFVSTVTSPGVREIVVPAKPGYVTDIKVVDSINDKIEFRVHASSLGVRRIALSLTADQYTSRATNITDVETLDELIAGLQSMRTHLAQGVV